MLLYPNNNEALQKSFCKSKNRKKCKRVKLDVRQNTWQNDTLYTPGCKMKAYK